MKMRTDRGRVLPPALLLAAPLLCAALSGPAGAATIGFAPAAQAVALGGTVQVDVAFSDLAGEIVSAYDLDVTYDSTVLDATGVVFSSALGDESFFEVLSDFDLSTPGIVDLAQISLLPDGVLAILQSGDPIVTATLVFDAIGVGTSQLGFVFDASNDVKGRNAAVLALTEQTASIRVAAAIPEPSAAILFGLGGVLMAGALRRGVAMRDRARNSGGGAGQASTGVYLPRNAIWSATQASKQCPR